jgi:hypothetical protein
MSQSGIDTGALNQTNTQYAFINAFKTLNERLTQLENLAP